VPTIEALFCQEPTDNLVTEFLNHYLASMGAALCKYYWQEDLGRHFNSLDDVVPSVATIMGRWDRNAIRAQIVDAMREVRDYRWRVLCESMGLEPYQQVD
jgi:hypothetical protein